MALFDDTQVSAANLERMQAATAALTHLLPPADWTLLGLLPSRLRFPDPKQPDKPAGALARWFAEQQQNAVVMRGHLLGAASLAGETAMRRAEELVAVPALEGFLEHLSTYAAQWVAREQSGHRMAAAYSYTLAGLWKIATVEPSGGQEPYEQQAFQAYLSQVPEPVRAEVTQRLTAFYADQDAHPRGTYIRTDRMRRYWWTLYALLGVRDNVALMPLFVGIKPHLVVDDEAAWDLLYQTVASDVSLRSTTLGLADFYRALVGSPNAPSAVDYLRGEMGLGREAAAAFARAHQMPRYNAETVGLGRSLLPTISAALDATVNAIRLHEIPENKLLTPEEFGALIDANRLLLGTSYAPGMIHLPNGESYLEQLMMACKVSFANPEAPDSRDLADFMALTVAGLSTVDLAREVPRAMTRGIPTSGLYLDPRITTAMLETIGVALEKMRQAIASLEQVTGHHVDLGDLLILSEALPALSEMVGSAFPLAPAHPHFSTLVGLDRAGEPKSTLVFALDQTNGLHMRMSWLTVPALVRVGLEVQQGFSPAKQQIEALGLTMLPYQGIVPRPLREDEIPQMYQSVTLDAQALRGTPLSPIPHDVAYHQSLV